MKDPSRNRGLTGVPEIERFNLRTSVDPESGCWFDVTNIKGQRRPCMAFRGKRSVRMSHVALILSGLNRPFGCGALHNCDEPTCVNPDHLRWGTQKDNMHEAATKMRMTPSAEKIARHKKLLTGRKLSPAHKTSISLAHQFRNTLLRSL